MAIGLTLKQQKFVDEYVLTGSTTNSAIAAGYSVNTADSQGSQLLSKPKIQDEIVKRHKAAAAIVAVDVSYVIGGLKRVYERCIQVEPVYDSKGNPTGEYRFDSSGAVRALELLGKHLGIFVDRHEVNVNVSMCDAMQAARERVIAAGIDLPALPAVTGYAIDEVIDAEVTAVVDSESDDQQEDSDGDDDE